MKRFVASMSVSAALAFAGCTHSPEKPAMTSTGDSMSMSSTDAAKASATDLHNTVCPVSGDKVESSRLTETYDGKVYHLCCNDCVKPFQKDPGKYEKAVAADPAKYGVATQKSQ
jgi:YHS domain-containing protein